MQIASIGIKIIVIIGLLIMKLNVAFGQNYQDDTLILNKIIVEYETQNNLFYIDKMQLPEECIISIKKNDFKYSDALNKLDSFKLTKSEQTYLIRNLNKKFKWNQNKISRIKEVDFDSSQKFLINSHKKQLFNANQALEKGDTISYRKLLLEPNYLFYFSKPVYLREKSICFLYYGMYYNISCYNSEFYFFKKENGVWIKYEIFSHSSIF